MKMNKKLTKRFLAVALSLVVALTTVFAGTPVTANAAAKTSITSYTSVKAGNTVNYTIKNLQKGQYAKVTFSGTAKGNILVKKGTSKLTSGKTKIVGTGKNIGLTVKTTETAVGRNYVLKVSTYNSKTNKRVSTTATKSAFVYKTCTAVKLDKETAEVVTGETVTLKETKTPANATNKVIWSSSDKAIATVANGVVTGVAAGKATITVKCGNVTATCEVTVKAKTATEVKGTVVGANTIKLNFNGSVDTAKAKLSLTKGSVGINADSIKFDDATTATFTTVSRLTKGEYTIKVSGITETPFTAPITVDKDETVSKIELVSKIAPEVTDPGKTATVTFKVSNQYGEGMQISSGLSWTASTGVAVIGGASTNAAGIGSFTITAANAADFIPNSSVYVTGVYVSGITSVIVNETVTIGMASKLDTVEVAGVYDTVTRKIVSLPANFAATRFVLLLTAYDQYGTPFVMVDTAGGADQKWDNLVITSRNPLLVSGFDLDTDVTVDGNSYQTVKLVPGSQVQKGGEAELQFVSTSTGKNSAYTLKVVESSMLTKFTLSAPTTLIAEGETVRIPFEAVDQAGNAITKFSALDGKVSLTGATLKEAANGTAYISYTAPATGASVGIDGIAYVTSMITSTGNFSSISFSFKEAAVPTTVMGFDSNSLCSTEMAIGATQTIAYTDLAIADQYGRQMPAGKIATWLGEAGNKITVTTTTGAPVELYQTSGISDVATVDITTAKTAVLSAKTPVGSTTERMKIALVQTAGTMIGSEKTMTFNVVEEGEYVDYVVNALPNMYVTKATAVPGTAYDVKVKVYGVKADGTKVKLPYDNNYYTLQLAVGAANYDGTKMTVGNGTINQADVDAFASVVFADANGGYTNVKGSVRVTVLATANGSAAKVIDLPIEFSTLTPYAADYDLDVYTPVVTVEGENNFATLQPVNGTITSASLNTVIAALCDQYGNWTYTAAPVITIKNVVAAPGFSVANNGKATASISGAHLGDKFTATFEVGKVTFDIKVTVGTGITKPYAGTAPTVTLSNVGGTADDTFNFNAASSTSMHYLIDTNSTAAASAVLAGIATTTGDTLTAVTASHDGKYIHVIASDANGNSTVVTYLITATNAGTVAVTVTLVP